MYDNGEFATHSRVAIHIATNPAPVLCHVARAIPSLHAMGKDFQMPPLEWERTIRAAISARHEAQDPTYRMAFASNDLDEVWSTFGETLDEGINDAIGCTPAERKLLPVGRGNATITLHKRRPILPMDLRFGFR